MRAAFGISIGIAAIDALLAAFIALTLLAFIVISPDLDRGAGEARELHVIEIEKISLDANDMPAKLLLDVQNGDPAQRVHSLPSTLISRMEASEAAELFKGSGQADWQDRQCATKRCTANLFVTRPSPRWAIRLRIAGMASDSALLPEKIEVRIRPLGAPSGCRATLTLQRPVIAQIDFRKRAITCPMAPS